MDAPVTIPPALRAAAEELGASLERSAPIATFRKAKASLDADEQAHGVLQRLEEALEVRRRRAAGSLTRDDIERILAAQEEARSNRVIAAYAEAEEEAISYLPQVNEVISKLLGCDFAAMAAAPSTC